MPSIATKTCPKCNRARRLALFGKLSRSADGLNPICRPCRNARERADYHDGDNAARINAARRDAYAERKLIAAISEAPV
jgi:hypothetical protein